MMENLKKTYIMKQYLETTDIYKHLLKELTNNNLSPSDLKQINSFISELVDKKKIKKSI